jgi:hypothetical protein
VVTIVGSGFGSVDPSVNAPPRVVLVVMLAAGRSVELELGVVGFDHDVINATMVPAAGANLSVIVQHGSSGVRATLEAAWSYDVPQVLDVVPLSDGSSSGWRLDASGTSSQYLLPCTANSSNSTNSASETGSSGSCRRRWFPATSTIIEVLGSNFGPDPVFAGVGGGIRITVGGQLCVPASGSSVYVDDSTLRCLAPATTVGDKRIAVEVAGQAADMPTPLEVVALCGPGYQGSVGEFCLHAPGVVSVCCW